MLLNRVRFSQAGTGRRRTPLRLLAFQGNQSDKHIEPKELMGEHGPDMTVYTVRVRTSFDRGSALNDANAGVMVCLVGKDGRSILHRIPSVYDPLQSARDLRELCDVLGDEKDGAKVDCRLVPTQEEIAAQEKELQDSLAAAAAKLKQTTVIGNLPQQNQNQGAAAALKTKKRFQEGQFDEVSFAAPDLGPLNAILLGTEGGVWRPEEIIVGSSRTGATDRFINKELIGGARGADSAVELFPVPADFVLYGDRPIPKKEASEIYEQNIVEYEDLKERTFHRAAVIVSALTLASTFSQNLQLVLSVLIGGTGSLLYGYLTTRAVDSVPGASKDSLKARYGSQDDDIYMDPDLQPGLVGPHKSTDDLVMLGKTAAADSWGNLASSTPGRLLLAGFIGIFLGLVNVTTVLDGPKQSVFPPSGSQNQAPVEVKSEFNTGTLAAGLLALGSYKAALLWESMASNEGSGGQGIASDKGASSSSSSSVGQHTRRKSRSDLLD